MWSGYFYKYIDSWVPALNWLPRWFSANSYPTLFDSIDPPANRAIGSGSFYLASGTAIPTYWQSPSITYNTSGNILQKFCESYTNEKEYLYSTLISLHLSRQNIFDISEPQYAWVVEFTDKIQDVLVSVGTGTVAIQKADSDLELFYSPEWKWKQSQDLLLISNLDYQNLTSYKDSDHWQFIDSSSAWSTGSMVFVLHPFSSNWIPIHPTSIREDGFLSINCSAVLKIRGASSSAARSLDEVLVYVNGERKFARRVTLSNSVDEKAIFARLTRRFDESNEELGSATIAALWFGTQSYRGTQSYISAALRKGQIITVSPSASSFTITSTALGFHIQDSPEYRYAYETLFAVDPTNSNRYLTQYCSALYGDALVRGIPTAFSVVSGTVSFSTYVNTVKDRPNVGWVLPMWTRSGSTVTFTSNMVRNDQDIYVFLNSNVFVTYPSEETKKLSFSRTSPTLRWASSKNEEEFLKGLANFDF